VTDSSRGDVQLVGRLHETPVPRGRLEGSQGIERVCLLSHLLTYFCSAIVRKGRLRIPYSKPIENVKQAIDRAEDLGIITHRTHRVLRTGAKTMTASQLNFDAYAFSKQPGYNEAAVRKEFAKAIPLRTVIIYCYDPRAVGIPARSPESETRPPCENGDRVRRFQ
jgi:hypothetical protein